MRIGPEDDFHYPVYPVTVDHAASMRFNASLGGKGLAFLAVIMTARACVDLNDRPDHRAVEPVKPVLQGEVLTVDDIAAIQGGVSQSAAFLNLDDANGGCEPPDNIQKVCFTPEIAMAIEAFYNDEPAEFIDETGMGYCIMDIEEIGVTTTDDGELETGLILRLTLADNAGAISVIEGTYAD